jgi:hypothetical protein
MELVPDRRDIIQSGRLPRTKGGVRGHDETIDLLVMQMITIAGFSPTR